MTHVEFVKPFGPYCPGETATFDDPVAIGMLKTGVAKLASNPRALDINPRSEDLAEKAFSSQVEMNDRAAAKVAQMTGKFSHPSANGEAIAAKIKEE